MSSMIWEFFFCYLEMLNVNFYYWFFKCWIKMVTNLNFFFSFDSHSSFKATLHFVAFLHQKSNWEGSLKRDFFVNKKIILFLFSFKTHPWILRANILTVWVCCWNILLERACHELTSIAIHPWPYSIDWSGWIDHHTDVTALKIWGEIEWKCSIVTATNFAFRSRFSILSTSASL